MWNNLDGIRHDIDKESVFLTKVKERYTQLLPNYPRFEIAESFFLIQFIVSLFLSSRLNKKTLFVFITNLRAYRFAQAPRPLSRTFVIQSDLPALLQDILSRLPLRLQVAK